MPKQTTAKGFPCKPEDCYVSRHLDGPEYKIYDLMIACAPLKNGKRLFYASVRPYLVNASNQAGSTVDATLARLEKAGWIIDLGRTRKPDGKLSPATYRIVEHPEWSASKGGNCPDYKLAPKDDEEYGVQRGQKRTTDLLPDNFRSRHPVLGRAISKVLAEEVSVITDEELAAWNKHLASHSEPVVVATHGQPGEVTTPLTVNRERATHSQPGEAYHGQPVVDQSRSTEKNPIKSILEKSSHTHTPDQNGVSVCVDKKPLDYGLAEEEIAKLQEGFVKHNSGTAGKCSTNQKKAMIELAMQHGREKFRAAARAWLKAEPWKAYKTPTTDPFTTFISSFSGYAATLAYENKRKDDEEKLKLTLKESYEVAAQQHREMYPELYAERPADEASAETLFENLTVEELQVVVATAAHKPIADERMRGINERKSKADSDAEEAKKSLEEGTW